MDRCVCALLVSTVPIDTHTGVLSFHCGSSPIDPSSYTPPPHNGGYRAIQIEPFTRESFLFVWIGGDSNQNPPSCSGLSSVGGVIGCSGEHGFIKGLCVSLVRQCNVRCNLEITLDFPPLGAWGAVITPGNTASDD